MLFLLFITGCANTSENATEVSNEEPSCITKPNTNSVQYSCDSQESTGQCVDYLEGFDTATMDITCNALEGTATEGAPCQESTTHVGSCCKVLNNQWFLTHYSASEDLSTEDLQSYCEDGEGVWFP